jgi:hypothetical protein
MRNPKQTIAYLDELRTLGFTDEAFWRIHHFREKGEKESINGHRSYCQVTDSFRDQGTNERVQIRLEIVLTYFKEYFSGNAASRVAPAARGDAEKTFIRLAEAAYVLVPPNLATE